ncbi:MAG: hypothetical protein AAF756_02285 [Pseudomonadota bacterium]
MTEENNRTQSLLEACYAVADLAETAENEAFNQGLPNLKNLAHAIKSIARNALANAGEEI